MTELEELRAERDRLKLELSVHRARENRPAYIALAVGVVVFVAGLGFVFVMRETGHWTPGQAVSWLFVILALLVVALVSVFLYQALRYTFRREGREP